MSTRDCAIARVVASNDAAQAILERKRGQHPVYVFTWLNDQGERHRTGRMRNTGVSNEDRKDLLGHKSRDVTTDYSAAELMSLVKAANLIIRSQDGPTLTVLRVAE